jgi:hypothetical protein
MILWGDYAKTQVRIGWKRQTGQSGSKKLIAKLIELIGVRAAVDRDTDFLDTICTYHRVGVKRGCEAAKKVEMVRKG